MAGINFRDVTGEIKAGTSVTVVIVNWNSEGDLAECLRRLERQTAQPDQVLVMDNGSQHVEVIDGLETRWSQLNLIIERLGSNKGFAIANNLGARLARGHWLALLNADAFPEPDWLEKLMQAAEKNPEFAFFASRQIQVNAPELLDGAGDAYHISGLGWRRYYNQPAKRHGLQLEEVFSPCGAAALYSREDFLQAGGFDEDYFSYFEDVDLGFRLRLSGRKCLYVPQAVVHHVGSASTGKRSDFSVYYGYRNLIWTFVKNMPALLFWIYLPLHIGTMLFFAVYLTFRGQGKAIWRAVFSALWGLPKMIAKRRTIQQNSKIKPGDLLRVMSTGLLEPYLEFVRRNGRK